MSVKPNKAGLTRNHGNTLRLPSESAAIEVTAESQGSTDSPTAEQHPPSTTHKLQSQGENYMQKTRKNSGFTRFWRFLTHWFAASTFAPTWLPRGLRHPFLGYLIALFLQAIALIITLFIAHLFPSFAFIDLLEIFTIALVALNWGFGPSLLATLAGAVLLDYFVLPPINNLTFASLNSGVEILLFLLTGLAISIASSQIERGRRHTEQLTNSLVKEHARLEAIIETVPDGVVIYDNQGKLLRLNESARKYSSALIQPETLQDIHAIQGLRTFTGEPYKLENFPITRALKGETIAGSEMRYLDSEGNDHFFAVSAAPLRNQQGDIDGVVTISHDLSALHYSEREAANRALELEAIFEAMADGIFVINQDGQIQRMNSAFRDLLGLNSETAPAYEAQSREERLFNLHIADENGRSLPLEEWPQSRILRGEVLQGAHAVDIQFRTLDDRITHLSVSGAPIHNRDGELVAALCICRDVTERRKLEQRTHDALNALLIMAETLVLVPEETRSTGELSPNALKRVAHRMVELTSSVLGCKRASISIIEPETEQIQAVAVVGLTPEQEARWWEEQTRQQVRLSDSTEPALVERLQNNEVLIIDMTKPPYNKQPNPYNVHSMLIAPMVVGKQFVGLLTLDYAEEEHAYSTEDKALAGAVAKLSALVFERERLLRDRAEARANELALRQANQQMEEFLGMVSHELKTPLTSIKGNTQLAIRQLRNSMQTFERILGLYEATEQQSRRLNRLVDDLLDVSRTRSGHLELLLNASDLREIVQDAVEEQRKAWPARIIELEIDEHTPLPIEADADRIAQVIANYLTNALKYSDAAYPVHVRVQRRINETFLSVQDHGPGLPFEEQTRIWERFHRAAGIEVLSSSHTSQAGLGLGLAISKTIIEGHGGQVGVESTLGEGSTFWFTLPLRPDSPSSLDAET